MKSILPSLWGGEERPFASLQKEIDQVFADFSKGLPAGTGVFNGKFPAVDVKETDDGLVVTAELPGVEEDDLDVSVADRYLTIKGEKKHEKETKEKDYHVSERSYGSFRRTLSLPYAPATDNIEASFDKGVLTVNLRKSPELAKAETRIKIGK